MQNIAVTCHVAVIVCVVGCGEPRVESAYKPKPLDVVVTLPDFDATPGSVVSHQPTTLPLNKKFEIRGTILNLPPRSDQERARRLEIEFRSSANVVNGSYLLEAKETEEHTLEFRGVILPLVRPGKHNIVIRPVTQRTDLARYTAVVQE